MSIKDKSCAILTTTLNSISWFITFVSLVLIDKAKPPFETFLNKIKDMPLRKTWKADIMEDALLLIVSIFILSIISILINVLGCKEEKLRIKLNPIFLVLYSLTFIIIYFIYF